MSVDAHFYSQNHFSQDYYLITNPNFSHFSSSALKNQQQKQQFFHQENIMEMGFNNNNNFVNNQGIINNLSYPYYCSSSNNYIANVNNESCLPSSMANLHHPVDALLQKHTNEVDHYLHIQGERLKEAMNQQKRQQMLLLAKFYESKSMALLKEKEENLEKLRVKSELLEEYLKKAEQESVVWQNLAKEKQEMVNGLNNMLLLAQQQNNIINTNHNHYYTNNNNNTNYNNNNNCNFNGNNGVEGDNDYAESVSDCESTNDNTNNGRRGIEEKQREETKKKISCKWCKNEIRSMVLLPCKHLCCCKSCEPFIGLCPICHCVKQGSIEVLFS